MVSTILTSFNPILHTWSNSNSLNRLCSRKCKSILESSFWRIHPKLERCQNLNKLKRRTSIFRIYSISLRRLLPSITRKKQASRRKKKRMKKLLSYLQNQREPLHGISRMNILTKRKPILASPKFVSARSAIRRWTPQRPPTITWPSHTTKTSRWSRRSSPSEKRVMHPSPFSRNRRNQTGLITSRKSSTRFLTKLQRLTKNACSSACSSPKLSKAWNRTIWVFSTTFHLRLKSSISCSPRRSSTSALSVILNLSKVLMPSKIILKRSPREIKRSLKLSKKSAKWLHNSNIYSEIKIEKL